MSESLYERLGGTEGINKIASDIVDLHAANKAIGTRFAESDIPAVKNALATFFIAGTGGPDVYEGKEMLEAHKGMNISATEFVSGLDDALIAFEKNNVGQREQEESLFILFGLRGDIVLV